MAKIELRLSFTSRFKKTKLYTSEAKSFFGLWVPPDIVMDGDEKPVRVKASHKGALDLISFKEYGTSDYWWAIAKVNNILHPPDDLVTGMVLLMPKLENIKAALLASKA